MACFPIYTTFYGDCRLEGLQIYLKRSLVAVDQKQDRISLVFLISLSFKENCKFQDGGSSHVLSCHNQQRIDQLVEQA